MSNRTFANVSEEKQTSAQPSKGRNGWCHKKMRYCKRNGFLNNKYKYSRRTGWFRWDQAPPRHARASKRHPSHPTHAHNASSTASTWYCSSTPSASTYGWPSSSTTVYYSSQDEPMGAAVTSYFSSTPSDSTYGRPSSSATVDYSSQDEPMGAAVTSYCSSTPSASTYGRPSSSATVDYSSQDEPMEAAATHASSTLRPVPKSVRNPSKYLAIDCEMVGTGPGGRISQLARCSLVSYGGDVVYDKYIKPRGPVTDYRTLWSGIRPSNVINATPYFMARKEILRLLMGKVVVGHGVHNDFKVLQYFHPRALIRDTSRIPLLNQRAGFPANQCVSLKRLTKAILNRDIQTGMKGHSSVEDARASMQLYRVVAEEWERMLESRSQASWHHR